MSITLFVIWENDPEMETLSTKLVSQARDAVLAHGAEDIQFGCVLTGQAPDRWVVSVRFPDFEVYGRAMNVLDNNRLFQDMVKRMPGRLISRNLVKNVDFG